MNEDETGLKPIQCLHRATGGMPSLTLNFDPVTKDSTDESWIVQIYDPC